MDRREALEKLPEFSAGCLDAGAEAEVRRWVEECPHCKAEWHSLQQFLNHLETLPPSHPTPQQSRQMWSRCSEALFDKIEAQRIQDQKPSLKLSLKPSLKPSLWNWARVQPRWGWAMLGGAVAILGATILAPESAPGTSGAPITLASTASTSGVARSSSGPSGAEGPSELQSLGRPPLYAATMVDHHAQMAADPFTDRVGSTLVSYSASYPISPEGASR